VLAGEKSPIVAHLENCWENLVVENPTMVGGPTKKRGGNPCQKGL